MGVEIPKDRIALSDSTALAAQSESPIINWGMRFYFGMLLLIFPIVTWWAIANFLEGWDTATWPTTEGKVTHLDIERVAELGVSYRIDLSYSYAVSDRPYVGQRLYVTSETFKDRAKAEAAVADLAVGRPVTVHYDREQPESSVLRVDSLFREYVMLLAIPGIFAQLAVLYFLYVVGSPPKPALEKSE